MDANSILIELSESDRTDFGRVDFSAQPEPQKVFSAIWELESQVNSGGFVDYFLNSDTDIISYAPDALGKIGAVACAAIVTQAIEIVAPLPASAAERSAAVESLDEETQERLETLDGDFLTYPDNLTELLFAFVKKHPDAFGSVPNLGSA